MLAMEEWESDRIVEQWILENDDTNMPLPSVEFNPHLLISKVRKHYMEYLIKLLSINYENSQKLLNKNIYLPSAIWRCAKVIEMSAAQTSMVLQLYRRNIDEAVKDLKKNTKKGLLYRKLYDCLHYPPENDKKTQATISRPNECTCQCLCEKSNRKKKLKRVAESPSGLDTASKNLGNSDKISSIINNIAKEPLPPPVPMEQDSPRTNNNLSIDPVQDSDDLMQQLEKLFQEDPNEDDLFDGGLFDAVDEAKIINENNVKSLNIDNSNKPESITESFEQHNKCLDERLSLLSGMLVTNESAPPESVEKPKKHRTSKWQCEEYFLKVKLFELLDQIRDCNRSKLSRVKDMLIDLFGHDSDDEGVVSPLEETPEFVISCKERIAPWVVKILTPYYVKGRIRGKSLFKSLAKHLIRLIYQCSRYPYEYEVHSFVKDFLDNHKMIRCEADFKQFRIDNV